HTPYITTKTNRTMDKNINPRSLSSTIIFPFASLFVGNEKSYTCSSVIQMTHTCFRVFIFSSPPCPHVPHHSTKNTGPLHPLFPVSFSVFLCTKGKNIRHCC